MNTWVVVAIIALLLIVMLSAFNTLVKAKASKGLMERNTSFRIESADYTKTMLVVGDSTGVGVGARTPEDTVAGRVAVHIGATYAENYAVSGAAVADLPPQIKEAKRDSYDLILVQIGGNDILASHSATRTAEELRAILKTLPRAEKVILLSAGNVGGATIFPFVVRPYHMYLTLEYHKAFEAAVTGTNVVYVNLYMPILKDPFLKKPNVYLAEDGLHPSSEGYGLWFEKVKEAL